MTGKRIWKVVFISVVVAVLVFGSIALYRLGFAHGAMTNFSFPETCDDIPEQKHKKIYLVLFYL